MNGIDELFADLAAGIPALPGALCRDQADEFDQYDDQAIVDDCITICHRCPELDPCRAYIESLPARHRPHGVIAGVCRRPPKPRKKEAS